MKRLWVCIIFGLMILVPPISTEASFIMEDNGVLAAPQTVRRIYGENIAEEIYLDVTTAQYRDLVMEFSSNGSRYIFNAQQATSGANYAARIYLTQMLQSLSNGRIEVEVIGSHFNVVGRLPGYLPGDHPVIVVSAHYDSAERSPGANADGSGISAVLNLARMLSKYDWPLDIYFVAFNAFYTDIPRSGSPEVSAYFQIQDIDILTLYNIDTLLVADPDGSASEQIQIGYSDELAVDYQDSQYWADMARMINNNYGAGIMTVLPDNNFYNWFSGDHYSFFEDDYRGMVCFSESGRAVDGTSNTPADIWNNNDFNYYLGKETTSTIGASIAFTMSRAYRESTSFDFDFTVTINAYEIMQFVITTPTIVNVSSRWYGGPAGYWLIDSSFSVVDHVEYYNTSAWEQIPIFSALLTTSGTYYLVAENLEFTSIGYDISLCYDSDIDGNGVLDKNEYWLASSYFSSDQDGDEVFDAYEIFYGTDMTNGDSDSDSMGDKYEIDMGFDPTDPSDANEDADQDGLTNAQECIGGLNPFSKDSDGDKIDDLWELTYGLNPLVNDANLDPDNDHMTNIEEYEAGTDPMLNDNQIDPFLVFVMPTIIIVPIIGYLYIRKKNQELLT